MTRTKCSPFAKAYYVIRLQGLSEVTKNIIYINGKTGDCGVKTRKTHAELNKKPKKKTPTKYGEWKMDKGKKMHRSSYRRFRLLNRLPPENGALKCSNTYFGRVSGNTEKNYAHVPHILQLSIEYLHPQNSGKGFCFLYKLFPSTRFSLQHMYRILQQNKFDTFNYKTWGHLTFLLINPQPFVPVSKSSPSRSAANRLCESGRDIQGC